MRSMTGEHLDPAVFGAVERALPKLIETLEDMKSTWPRPGDEGMGSLQEAQLSERDQASAEKQPAPAGGGGS
jgi:hypothetical protein